MDFLKDLDREVKTKKDESEQFLAEANSLLLTAGNQEREALIRAGLDVHITQVDHSRTVEIERAKFEKQFSGRIVTKDEIKSVCLKYDLRFLRSQKFTGKVDALAGIKLLELQKSGISFDQNDFFVMAPPTAFNLEDKPKKVKQLDPALFYRIPKSASLDGGMFLMVHKWGKDFTFMRRIMGFFYKNVFNMMSMITLLYLLISHIAFFNIMHIHQSYHIGDMIAFVCSILLAMVTLGLMFKDNPEDWKDSNTSNMWDREFKRGRVN